MAKLSDLVNINRSVEVSPGVSVVVRSLALIDLATLLATFPAIKEAVGSENMAEKLLASLPDAAYAIIKRGLVDDDINLTDIANLPFGVQFTLLHAILHETVPGGFGPFAVKFGELVEAVNTAGNKTPT